MFVTIFIHLFIHVSTMTTSRFVTILCLYVETRTSSYNSSLFCVFCSTKRTTNGNEVQKREPNRLEYLQAFVFVFSRLLTCSLSRLQTCAYIQNGEEDTMNQNKKKPSDLKIIIILAFFTCCSERTQTRVNVLSLWHSSEYSLHHHHHHHRASLLLHFVVVDSDVAVVILSRPPQCVFYLRNYGNDMRKR